MSLWGLRKTQHAFAAPSVLACSPAAAAPVTPPPPPPAAKPSTDPKDSSLVRRESRKDTPAPTDDDLRYLGYTGRLGRIAAAVKNVRLIACACEPAHAPASILVVVAREYSRLGNTHASASSRALRVEGGRGRARCRAPPSRANRATCTPALVRARHRRSLAPSDDGVISRRNPRSHPHPRTHHMPQTRATSASRCGRSCRDGSSTRRTASRSRTWGVTSTSTPRSVFSLSREGRNGGGGRAVVDRAIERSSDRARSSEIERDRARSSDRAIERSRDAATLRRSTEGIHGSAMIVGSSEPPSWRGVEGHGAEGRRKDDATGIVFVCAKHTRATRATDARRARRTRACSVRQAEMTKGSSREVVARTAIETFTFQAWGWVEMAVCRHMMYEDLVSEPPRSNGFGRVHVGDDRLDLRAVVAHPRRRPPRRAHGEVTW